MKNIVNYRINSEKQKVVIKNGPLFFSTFMFQLFLPIIYCLTGNNIRTEIA